MVVVQDHDCCHNRGGHHEHDAIEIGACFEEEEEEEEEGGGRRC